MNQKALRLELLTLLTDLLGEFKRPGTSSIPAIYVGEPPSEFVASGLECNIKRLPRMNLSPLQNNEAELRRTFEVRLIEHSGTDLEKAVLVLARRFKDAEIRQIDASERLGVLSQVVFLIQ